MIGGLLKAKRLSKGLTLETISADLKIRVSSLKALEEENFDIFPADVYIMGYIRTYAMYLGIEPEPLIEEFKALRERQKPSQDIPPETLEADKIESRDNSLEIKGQKSDLKSQRSIISFGLSFKPNFLILGVIILIGGVTIFSIFKTTRPQKELTLADRHPKKSEVFLETPTPPVPVQFPQTPSSAAFPQLKDFWDARDNTLKQTPSSSQPVQPQAPVVTPPEPAPSVSPEAASGNKSFNLPSEGYNLKIVASELSWVLVESEEGSHDITLKPGEAVQYTSKKGFKIKTGNAGGIKLLFNGKDMGFPGKSGEVKIINLP